MRKDNEKYFRIKQKKKLINYKYTPTKLTNFKY